ncbi:hypothetical protein V6Z11_D08G097300 [Gossypium hirsutum]
MLPFWPEEFRKAIFDMHLNKTLGLAGMNLTFFQKWWNIIGPDIVTQCCGWLKPGSFPTTLNDTTIVLIPKKDKSDSMKDLHCF